MEEEIVARRGRPPAEKSDEPKRATKPGWKPASMLGTLKAPPGYEARWVRNDPAAVAKKKAEGWIVMRPQDNTGTAIVQTDVADQKTIGDYIVYRDCIAMMLSHKDKAAREEYHRQEIDGTMKQILHDADNEIGKLGGSTYKPKGMAGRIVIN